MNAKIPFRMIAPNKYFPPPVIPDGVIYGQFNQADNPTTLLDINETGVVFNETLYRWTDIEYISMTEEGIATLQTKKLTDQNLSFCINSMYSLNDEGEKVSLMQGYSIALCLINRVFLENQRRTN